MYVRVYEKYVLQCACTYLTAEIVAAPLTVCFADRATIPDSRVSIRAVEIAACAKHLCSWRVIDAFRLCSISWGDKSRTLND